MYLTHHELESVVIVAVFFIINIVIIYYYAAGVGVVDRVEVYSQPSS